MIRFRLSNAEHCNCGCKLIPIVYVLRAKDYGADDICDPAQLICERCKFVCIVSAASIVESIPRNHSFRVICAMCLAKELGLDFLRDAGEDDALTEYELLEIKRIKEAFEYAK